MTRVDQRPASGATMARKPTDAMVSGMNIAAAADAESPASPSTEIWRNAKPVRMTAPTAFASVTSQNIRERSARARVHGPVSPGMRSGATAAGARPRGRRAAGAAASPG